MSIVKSPRPDGRTPVRRKHARVSSETRVKVEVDWKSLWGKLRAWLSGRNHKKTKDQLPPPAQELGPSEGPLKAVFAFAHDQLSTTWVYLDSATKGLILLSQKGAVAKRPTHEYCICPALVVLRPLSKAGDSFSIWIVNLVESNTTLSFGIVASNGDLGRITGEVAVGRDPNTIGIFLPEVSIEDGKTEEASCIAVSSGHAPIRFANDEQPPPRLRKPTLSFGQGDRFDFVLTYVHSPCYSPLMSPAMCLLTCRFHKPLCCCHFSSCATLLDDPRPFRSELGLEISCNGQLVDTVPVSDKFQVPFLPCCTVPKGSALKIGDVPTNTPCD